MEDCGGQGSEAVLGCQLEASRDGEGQRCLCFRSQSEKSYREGDRVGAIGVHSRARSRGAGTNEDSQDAAEKT